MAQKNKSSEQGTPGSCKLEMPCDYCGQSFPATALQDSGPDGLLCPYCWQELHGCGCSDPEETSNEE